VTACPLTRIETRRLQFVPSVWVSAVRLQVLGVGAVAGAVAVDGEAGGALVAAVFVECVGVVLSAAGVEDGVVVAGCGGGLF
jgi:hypothetical protein